MNNYRVILDIATDTIRFSSQTNVLVPQAVLILNT